MDEREWLARRFEEDRSRLRAVAYQMLGSLTDADDAVQEAWLRLSRSYDKGIENLSGWLTTVVGRVCMDMLRARRVRHVELFEATTQPVQPLHESGGTADPEERALLADSIGLALLVVLETLDPVERIAFVLHDMFGVPFDEIAPIIERTPANARQIASRARRRVRGGTPAQDADIARRRDVVEAFVTAARGGSFEGLLAVLDPDVVVRSDSKDAPPVVRGAMAVARGATMAKLATAAQTALVNGAPGVIAYADAGYRVMTFEIVDDRITEVEVITDPERLRHLELAVFGD
ncbi:sigma-70 family RNA polymerase sigma factor [Streptomyces thermoviolaceus]|jgi:RNA polymerase sigma-70 factor (ECF subfamily)|uniref:Sigma-70 family RNA polymerase sigma factor n=1 Tax=Streptomyces thermoviolaceus subsp. thermoviolaceus TaxID=66860 RepID=A0ABX0YW21_STRTL|nr:sigma-70 family RNA polymerase sigma factor [Streptomyces thermoviolaceus]NJP15245.1 sigma-70 family RNA polymerase sigma factor [Streptomyces thermoviolaceus subsp. thermoviolaceus]WTD50756.1 sigma-70 family RNA polymerase sigma factor [Streptomyces thermoviolaceus]GGV76656.1 DNA-directed RNA polymerase sigma-70 factor [Streptomyces thermoviolaceus subsp. apingens]